MEDRVGFVYLIGILWSLGLFVAWNRFESKRGLLLLGMIPLGAIVVFRYSGTDTFMYESALWNSYLTGRSTQMEYGFDLLSRWLTGLSGSPLVTVRLLGALFVGMLALFLWRSTRQEAFFLLVYFIPVFLYQYGMNAVRAGLGMGMLLLAWQFFQRGRMGPAVILALLAPLFQITLLVPLVILASTEILRMGRRGWLLLGALGMLVVLFGFLNWERIGNKLALYFGEGEVSLHTVHSPQAPGASRTAMSLLLLAGLMVLPLPLGLKVFSGVAWGGLVLAFQLLAYYSPWVGIRLLELMTFSLPLLGLGVARGASFSQAKRYLLALALASALGVAFNHKNFMADFGGRLTGSPTPFLPYRTVFDYNPCPPSYHFPWALPWRCPMWDWGGATSGGPLSPYSPHPPYPW